MAAAHLVVALAVVRLSTCKTGGVRAGVEQASRGPAGDVVAPALPDVPLSAACMTSTQAESWAAVGLSPVRRSCSRRALISCSMSTTGCSRTSSTCGHAGTWPGPRAGERSTRGGQRNKAAWCGQSKASPVSLTAGIRHAGQARAALRVRPCPATPPTHTHSHHHHPGAHLGHGCRAAVGGAAKRRLERCCLLRGHLVGELDCGCGADIQGSRPGNVRLWRTQRPGLTSLQPLPDSDPAAVGACIGHTARARGRCGAPQAPALGPSMRPRWVGGKGRSVGSACAAGTHQ